MGGLIQTNSNPKCPQSDQVFIFVLGGGGTPDQLKLQVPSPEQNFIFGHSRPTFLKYLSGGTQGILNQKFW